MINAGHYRHAIIVKKRVVTGQTNSGAEIEEWQKVFMTRGKFNKLSARDLIAANAVQSKIVGQFTIRYRDITNGEYRLYWRDKVYKIIEFLPDNRSGRRELILPISQDL